MFKVVIPSLRCTGRVTDFGGDRQSSNLCTMLGYVLKVRALLLCACELSAACRIPL